jgi:Uma2 family endonuclease
VTIRWWNLISWEFAIAVRLIGEAVTVPPDMVVEILSPTNSKHDRVTKFRKYQAAEVREYWIVDPRDKTVWVQILEQGRYSSTG